MTRHGKSKDLGNAEAAAPLWEAGRRWHAAGIDKESRFMAATSARRFIACAPPSESGAAAPHSKNASAIGSVFPITFTVSSAREQRAATQTPPHVHLRAQAHERSSGRMPLASARRRCPAGFLRKAISLGSTLLWRRAFIVSCEMRRRWHPPALTEHSEISAKCTEAMSRSLHPQANPGFRLATQSVPVAQWIEPAFPKR